MCRGTAHQYRDRHRLSLFSRLRFKIKIIAKNARIARPSGFPARLRRFVASTGLVGLSLAVLISDRCVERLHLSSAERPVSADVSLQCAIIHNRPSSPKVTANRGK